MKEAVGLGKSGCQLDEVTLKTINLTLVKLIAASAPFYEVVSHLLGIIAVFAHVNKISHEEFVLSIDKQWNLLSKLYPLHEEGMEDDFNYLRSLNKV